MHEKMDGEALPPDVKQVIWTVLIIFIALAVFIILLVVLFNNRKNKLVKDKILMQVDFDRSLLQTQIEIQEQTLKTISQEIHDNVGQVLSLAKLNLYTLDFDTGVSREEKISKSIQLVGKAINDLRDLSRSLNGDKFANLGLQDALDNELKIIHNTGQFHTALVTEGAPYSLLPQNEMVLFRIAQQSLNNVVKHSKAKNVEVTMIFTKAQFRMEIKDDGAGFDAEKLQALETGIGLINMRNRATMIGAQFSIDSAPGNGCRILIQLSKPNT